MQSIRCAVNQRDKISDIMRFVDLIKDTYEFAGLPTYLGNGSYANFYCIICDMDLSSSILRNIAIIDN